MFGQASGLWWAVRGIPADGCPTFLGLSGQSPSGQSPSTGLDPVWTRGTAALVHASPGEPDAGCAGVHRLPYTAPRVLRGRGSC